MRDYPYLCPNGDQIIKITDPDTKSILSKIVKECEHGKPIFGNAEEMLSKIKKFTNNKNMTLRSIRRLATNDYYKNMWNVNDLEAKAKFKYFLYRMRHSESTSKNIYLSPKELITENHK